MMSRMMTKKVSINKRFHMHFKLSYNNNFGIFKDGKEDSAIVGNRLYYIHEKHLINQT